MLEAGKNLYIKCTKRNPLLIVALGLIIGIRVGGHEIIDGLYNLPLIAACFLFLLSSLFARFEYRKFSQFMMLLAFVSTGLLLENLHRLELPQTGFPKQDSYQFVIQERLGMSQGRYKCASLQHPTLPGVAIDVPEEVTLNSGDTITCFKGPKEIFSREIPGVFNYRKFLQRKGIGFQLKINDAKELSIYRSKPNLLVRWRSHLYSQISKLYENEHHASIVQAFILGDRSMLSEEASNIYRRSGAMHVLAVSGLHVGMISLILNVLILGIRRFEKLKTFRVLFVLSGIWAFALLTGLGSSVVRAGIMFSALQFHLILGRGTKSSYNIMCAAAIAILVVNPKQLYDIGFQFSFLAVLGILLFGQRIYGLVTPRNRVLSYAWGIVAISLAAQLFITPFALYYFSEVSTVSVLSSLIAIPSAALILFGSIFSLGFNEILPELGQIISLIVETTISVLDFMLELLSQWAYASFSVNRFSSWELTSIVIVIGLFYIGMVMKSPLFKVSALCLMFSICSMQQWNAYELKSRLAVLEYKQKSKWKKVYCLGNSLIINEGDEPSKWLLEYARTQGITDRVDLPSKASMPQLRHYREKASDKSRNTILDNPFIKFYKLSSYGNQN